MEGAEYICAPSRQKQPVSPSGSKQTRPECSLRIRPVLFTSVKFTQEFITREKSESGSEFFYGLSKYSVRIMAEIHTVKINGDGRVHLLTVCFLFPHFIFPLHFYDFDALNHFTGLKVCPICANFSSPWWGSQI